MDLAHFSMLLHSHDITILILYFELFFVQSPSSSGRSTYLIPIYPLSFSASCHYLHFIIFHRIVSFSPHYLTKLTSLSHAPHRPNHPRRYYQNLH